MSDSGTQSVIQEQLNLLSHSNGLIRKKARAVLIEIGRPAVEELVALLNSPSEQLRWEAAKILSEIADETAASALVQTLHDESFGVRWLASEGLIRIRAAGLKPLLEGLANNAGSSWFRNGAQHVIRILASDESLHELLAPVLESLQAVEPAATVPVAARKALQELA
jgi:HEAT repeat protein